MSGRKKNVFGQLNLCKRFLALFLCIILAIGLSACGENKTNDGSKTIDESKSSEPESHDTPSLIYVPEELELRDDGDYMMSTVQFVGDKLYYQVYLSVEDEETGVTMYDVVLRCHSLVSNTVTDLSAGGGEWSIGEDGSIYTIMTEWNGSENGENGHIERFLVKKNDSEEELFRQDITELFSGDEYISLRLAVDAQGRSYLLMDSGIYLFDENGKPSGIIRSETDVTGIFLCSFSRGSDGKVYLSDGNATGGSTTLYEVDFEAGKLGTGYPDIPSNGRNPSCDADGNLLTFDNTAVYRYNLKEQKKEKVFEWSDSGINVSFVSAVGELSNGSIAVVYQDWETSESGVVLMTGVSAEEVPQVQKKEIVIGCTSSDQGLLGAVTAFNKNSEDYHISVKTYGDGDDEEDAVLRLQADIISGNGPDIIQLHDMRQTWPELAEKGAFEDLLPYLENGSLLTREELLEGVIHAYTYDGKLAAIPSVIQLQTYLGSTALVGEEMGWTIDDVIALADANPGAELIEGYNGIGILRFCLEYSMDGFIDWEQGTCHFDGEEFKRLLEFAKRYHDVEDVSSDLVPSWRERVQNGELLLCFADFYEFSQPQRYEASFQGQFTAIGSPSSDGRPVCTLTGSDPLAISSKSDVKEGAWAFIESYVTTSRISGWMGFPTTRTRLDEMIEKETEYMTDADGNPVLDEFGNYQTTHPTVVMFPDGTSYTKRIPTQREIDMIMDMIQVASLYGAGDQQILEDIIIEEVGAYFSGQKSVDEVADIIQRRAGIYVSEHM